MDQIPSPVPMFSSNAGWTSRDDLYRTDFELAVQSRGNAAGAQRLGSVRAEIRDRADRDDPPRLRRAPAANAGDEPEAAGDADQQRTRRLRHLGVLGMAAILTLTSYAQRTSPVLRGKWVLEELLGTPPKHQ